MRKVSISPTFCWTWPCDALGSMECKQKWHIPCLSRNFKSCCKFHNVYNYQNDSGSFGKLSLFSSHAALMQCIFETFLQNYLQSHFWKSLRESELHLFGGTFTRWEQPKTYHSQGHCNGTKREFRLRQTCIQIVALPFCFCGSLLRMIICQWAP